MTRIRFDGRDPARSPLSPALRAPVRHLPVSLRLASPRCQSRATRVDAVPGLDADARRDRLARARLYLCTDARRDAATSPSSPTRRCAGGVDILQLREKGRRAAGGARRARRARGAGGGVRPPRRAARGQRPRRRRAGRRRRRAAPRAGRPARWRGRRRVVGDDVLIGRSDPRRRRGRRGRRRARRRLLLHRAVLADPDQAGPPGAGARPGPDRRRAGARPAVVRDRRDRRRPGSPRCWPRAPTGSSSCGRSPRPTTPRPPPAACAPASRGDPVLLPSFPQGGRVAHLLQPHPQSVAGGVAQVSADDVIA